MKRYNLSINDIAHVGLYLDDPYGDGIRLEEIRDPSIGRLAALAEVTGEPILDGERLIREEYERKVMVSDNWTGRGDLVASIVRNMRLE